MLKIQNTVGPAGYGALVTFARRYDQKRVDEGKIEKKEIFKKLGTYAYAVPGLITTGASAFGWLHRWADWTEPMANGFMYDIPNFVMSLVDAFSIEGASSYVSEAERIAREARARTAARKPIGQTTKPGWETVKLFE